VAFICTTLYVCLHVGGRRWSGTLVWTSTNSGSRRLSAVAAHARRQRAVVAQGGVGASIGAEVQWRPAPRKRGRQAWPGSFYDTNRFQRTEKAWNGRDWVLLASSRCKVCSWLSCSVTCAFTCWIECPALLLLLAKMTASFIGTRLQIFTAWCYVSVVYAVIVCLSFRPSVCPSQAGTVQKQLNLGSHNWHCAIAQGFLMLKISPKFLRGQPQRGCQIEVG